MILLSLEKVLPEKRFRPLTGMIRESEWDGCREGFRPLTGIIPQKQTATPEKFSPPYGDYTKDVKAYEKVYKFPPPDGDHTLVSKGFDKEIYRFSSPCGATLLCLR